MKISLKWISNQISTSYNEVYLFNRGKEKEREKEREGEGGREKEREREREKDRQERERVRERKIGERKSKNFYCIFDHWK